MSARVFQQGTHTIRHRGPSSTPPFVCIEFPEHTRIAVRAIKLRRDLEGAGLR